MGFKNISTLLITLTLFSSCSLIKSIKKTETVIYVDNSTSSPESRHDQRKVVDKDVQNRESSSRKKAENISPEQDKSSANSPVIEPIAPKPLPVIKFSATESANVRIPLNLNNPFPSSDELIVSLPELRADFCYPYMGKVISQYGPRGRSNHTGVDIKAIPRDTIRAAFSGVVRMSKPYSGYGNIIVIRHYNGIETVYSHQAKNLVEANDVVKSGDPIGLAGRTGTATTEHLHFELRVASQALNPNLLLDTENRTLRNDTLYFYKKGSSVVAYNHLYGSRESGGSGVNLAQKGSNSASEHIISGGTSGKSSDSDSSGAIIVPVGSSSVETKNPTTSTNNTNITSTKSSSKSTIYHTIKQGDTLYKLSRMYSISVDKICKLNGIKPTKTLKIKDKIRIS